MDITRIESSVDAHAAAFDSLARSLDSRHQRRRVFGLLAAAVATGVLGTASRSQEAQAKNKRKKKGRKKGGKGGQGTPTGDPGTGNPPGTPPPVLQICANAAECGNDADGNMCACRDHESGQRICSQSGPGDVRFFPAGTPCTVCQGGEQCFLVNGGAGGIECIFPCKV